VSMYYVDGVRTLLSSMDSQVVDWAQRAGELLWSYLEFVE
jgi:hypothetical protein